MSEWEIDGREVTSNSLWRVIEDFENGALAPGAREELFQILEESPRARSIYLAYFELSALLQIKAETKREEGTLPVLPRAGTQRKALGYSVLAAAAVLVLVALGAALVKLREPEPRSMALEAAAGTVWTTTGSEASGDGAKPEVVEGAAIHVRSGTLSLSSDSGVRMIVQGPASVRFPSFEAPVIERGWLWVDSGPAGNQLRIAIPQGTLENIGTRFGVRVRGEDHSELHLHEGVVEATWNADGAPTRFSVTDEGVILSPQGPAGKGLLAADPFPGVDEILSAEHSYATTVMGQSPVGYWRLEGENPREAVNAVPEGSVGLYSTGVQPGVPGVRPEDGWHGFEPENRAVFLSGAANDSVVHHLDGRDGVSPKEGAVGFWFRREPGLPHPEVLWFAGVPGGSGLGPNDEMQVFLSAEGRLNFFIEEGRYDVLLSSPRRADDGAWHHVVATWSLDRVELYLDGQLVSRDDEYRRAEGPHFKGTDVRLGKTGSGTDPGRGRNLMPFEGAVDELALWGRTLTPTEITQQFRAAVGSPPSEEAGVEWR